MNDRVKKVFGGILLLITAVALIFYGMGYGASIFDMPIYKLLISAVIVAWIIAKIFFSDSLRNRFKIFIPLALLFMVLETEIARWTNFGSENIVNNWIVLLSAILASIAIDCIIPKKKKSKGAFGINNKNHLHGNFESYDTNSLSSNTVYIDPAKIKKSFVKNMLGETIVYYQNSDGVSADEQLELNLYNLMGETTVHVPSDWVVTDKMQCAMGEVNVRPNTGEGVHLTLMGSNKMGETSIVSP